MKLWDINGITPVTSFGTGGVLTINPSNPVSISGATVTLPAGSYMTEIRLTNVSGRIARYREVTEIWSGLTASIVFAPTDYVDPSEVPANSGADLANASIIDSREFGSLAGAGAGGSDGDPKAYSLFVGNIANVAVNLILAAGSEFAAVSWMQNTGSGGVYTAGIPSGTLDFSTNNVLWVKVVSEDSQTTRYYKFSFESCDLTISGSGGYAFLGDESLHILTITADGTYTIGMRPGVTTTSKARISVDSGVTANITLNGVDIDMSGRSGVPAFDLSWATVNLTLTGNNILKSGQSAAGLHVPDGAALTITDSTGSLEATGGSNGAGIGGGYYSSDHGAISALNGNAVVFAWPYIGPSLPANDKLAIVFNGDTGTMYGNVTMQQDVEIPAGYTLALTGEP